jgi:hypothetical protein
MAIALLREPQRASTMPITQHASNAIEHAGR